MALITLVWTVLRRLGLGAIGVWARQWHQGPIHLGIDKHSAPRVLRPRMGFIMSTLYHRAWRKQISTGSIRSKRSGNNNNLHRMDVLRPRLIIASTNLSKIREMESMLRPLPIVVSRQPCGLNVEETGRSYIENALIKARAAAKLTNSWTLADDSGLEVDALKGGPGLYSARYAPSNEEKIGRLLNALGDSVYRGACFRSTMVFCAKDGHCVAAAEGVCRGQILRLPAYSGGGFESLLWVREAGCTYGEMGEAQLNRLGSRGKAARQISGKLLTHLGVEALS